MNVVTTTVELIIGGIAIGSVYSLVALAHSLIWSGVRVVNFAQGEVFMGGAFISLAFLSGVPALARHAPLFWAVAIGLGAAAALGLLIYVGTIAPTTRKGFLYVIAGCVGASMLLQNVAILVWGSSGMAFPSFFSTVPVALGPFLIVPQDLWVTGISMVSMLALWLFLSRTRIGTAMRAASQNRAVAGLMGVDHRRTDALTIGIASALVGLAAVLLAPRFFVTPQMGSIVSSKAFTAAVLGGFGNIPGAVVGGILLGILENLSAGFISSAYKDATSFVVLIAILMLRPSGLLDAGAGRRA